MTLGDALNTLSSRETSQDQDAIVAELRDDIVQGASLSEALAQHPASFSTLYVSMVRAGEASGTLPEVLERLCSHYERVQEAREKVMMALVYPAIIMLVGAGTMIFSMVFVIPRFTAIFDELGGESAGADPAPDRHQRLSSSITGGPILLAILGGVYPVPAGAAHRRRAALVARGLLLRLPAGQEHRCRQCLRALRPHPGRAADQRRAGAQALSIVENTVGNTVIADEIREARDRVTDGSTISGPLAEGKVFPRLLTDMLAVGEESGDMSGALGHIANRYERELDRTVKIFTTVLEPIMILVMAVLVGFVAISMLMAVFDMTSGLNP